MTREEAIYCLQSYQPDNTYSMCVKCKYYASGCKSNEARAMAIEALKRDVPDTNFGKWIPCSERLPEADSDEYGDGLKESRAVGVLCKSNDFGNKLLYGVGRLIVDVNDGFEGWNGYCEPMYDLDSACISIIAWCELPEPWKGENNE